MKVKDFRMKTEIEIVKKVNKKREGVDIFKVGVFLLGVSATVFAGIAIHWYYKIQTEKPWKPGIPGFWARCEEKTIIIEAREDLNNVLVKDNVGKTICNFGTIKKGSDEVCFVNSTGIFVVETSDTKKVVSCRETREIVAIPKVD